MSITQIYLATKKFRQLFVEPAGRYTWFFERMKLVHREGSYLFLHAGLDDTVAENLKSMDEKYLNDHFQEQLHNNPYDLYYGSLGNVFRTKYRKYEFAFTAKGVEDLHETGIHALVHGHRNILNGQRLAIRQGMLNFECDASIDANTRTASGLKGPGAAVVIFLPDGTIKARSVDYPYTKTFHPNFATLKPAKKT